MYVQAKMGIIYIIQRLVKWVDGINPP
jgi:hypothetical protein